MEGSDACVGVGGGGESVCVWCVCVVCGVCVCVAGRLAIKLAFQKFSEILVQKGADINMEGLSLSLLYQPSVPFTCGSVSVFIVHIHSLILYYSWFFNYHSRYSRTPQAPRFYLAAMEKNWEKAWYQYYVTDRKWWTRFHNDGNMPTQYAANTASDRIVKLA